MGRRPITDEQHALLLIAYRELAGDHSHAAVAAAVDRRTARRAWEKGWPGRRAIQEQLADERVMARAALSKEALLLQRAAAPLLAAEDAAQSAAREGHLARLARDTAIDPLGEVAQLKGYVGALAKRVAVTDPSQLDDREALARMNAVATVAQKLVAVAAQAQSIEHLRLGKPTDIIGLQPMPIAVTLDEVAAEVAAAQRALVRAQAAGTAPYADGNDDPSDCSH